MKSLILKLGATGDVVRTTPLLARLAGEVVWVTETKNIVLLEGVSADLRCFSWEDRGLVPKDNYDLIINLEDTLEVALYARQFNHKQWFGAYAGRDDVLSYTEDSRGWFDLSLISRHGRCQADRLKFLNRRTYQDLIFQGLGFSFTGERYALPDPQETDLSGDVAIASEAGPIWPMKNWAHYAQLKHELEARGLVVNILPKRSSLLDHLGDVRNHPCLVGGDSLPMHFALGIATKCVTLFTCTSPWEIYGYDVQKQLVSPLLERFFYKRGFDRRATTVINLSEVLDAVIASTSAGIGAGRLPNRGVNPSLGR